MKRRYLIAAGSLAAGILAVVAAMVTLFESGVTKAQVDRVELGMTPDQVEKVLGRPADEEITIPAMGHGNNVPVAQFWFNADGSAAVISLEHAGGIVDGKEWSDSTETIGGRLRRWVRWPW